jgi:hypothetical protein
MNLFRMIRNFDFWLIFRFKLMKKLLFKVNIKIIINFNLEVCGKCDLFACETLKNIRMNNNKIIFQNK